MTVATRRQTALALKLIREVDTFECYGFPCVIQYDPCDKTYPMLVDSQVIGNATTPDTARTTISTFCEELSRHTRATTADMAADKAVSVDEELAAQGLRLADEDEAGYYVLITGGKHVWATDEPPRFDNPVAPIFEEETAPYLAPTRDALTTALDRSVTARLATTRGTDAWRAAQAVVEQAHAALDPVGYRAARDAVPYAALGEDLEGVAPFPIEPTPDWLTLGDCEGYDGNGCREPATREIRINIALNPDALIDPDLVRVCDRCAVRWARYVIPASTCCACGQQHDIQRCPQISARAGLPPIRSYDKGAGTGGDPVLVVLIAYQPGDYLLADDPCAGVRAERNELLAALKNVLAEMPRPVIDDKPLNDALEAAEALVERLTG